jgi:hypothetical protein
MRLLWGAKHYGWRARCTLEETPQHYQQFTPTVAAVSDRRTRAESHLRSETAATAKPFAFIVFAIQDDKR